MNMLIISALIGLLLGLATACSVSKSMVKTIEKPYCTALVSEVQTFPEEVVIDPKIKCSEDIAYDVTYFNYRDGIYKAISIMNPWCTRIEGTKTFMVSENKTDFPRLCQIHVWAKNNPAQRITITVQQYGKLPFGFIGNTEESVE